MLNELPGIAITHLLAGFIYYNLYRFVDIIKSAGFIGANYGEDDKIVMVAPGDIAFAAAEELVAPATGGKIRYVASAELTANEAARILGAAIGKPDLQWVTFTDEQAKSGMEQQGLPLDMVTNSVELGAAIHSGVMREDYDLHKPTSIGKVKLEDFAKDFAQAYNTLNLTQIKKVFIRGANKSIGFETARQLLRKGCYVYLGSRNIKNGQEAAENLKAEGLNEVEAIQIDVSDAESVKAAHAEIGKKTDVLDVLINNAGISGDLPQKATDTDIAVFRQVFDTNVFGVVQVTQAFMDLLKKSPQPRIVNLTSGLGSLTLHKDPAWKYYTVKAAVYNSSKAALNMYTITLAYELRDTPFKVNVVHPGYTATDFNHHSGPGTVEDAAKRVVKCAMIGNDGPTGTFFSDDNAPETGISPW